MRRAARRLQAILGLPLLAACGSGCGDALAPSTPPSTAPMGYVRPAVGRVSITPAAPIEVEARGTWTFHYEAEGTGIARGGAIAFRVWPESGWTAPQIDRPDAPGYLSVETDAPTARFRVESRADPETLHEPIVLRLFEGALRAGERVVLRYADARAGSFAQQAQRFLFSVDAEGDGEFREVAEPPQLRMLPGAPTELWVVAPAIVPRGRSFAARASLLDAWGNLVRSRTLEGAVPMTRYRDDETGLAGRSGRVWWAEPEQPWQLFWGDLHGHSSWSDGVGEPGDYFAYARDVAGLDFAALTDHDVIGPRVLDALRWDSLREIADAHNTDGRFVTLFGYEYTNGDTGHLTVLSPRRSLPLLSSAAPATQTVEGLWAQLAALDLPVLTVPHHPGGSTQETSWEHFDARFVKLVEIFSVHGSSECFECPLRVPRPREGSFVRDALRRGHRFAFIGSGDTHNGHPGRSPRNAPHRTGLVGVWASELTREAIWSALVAGRSFATTGARIVPVFRREGDRFEVWVRAADPIERVEIIKGDAVAELRKTRAEELRFDWVDPDGSRPGDVYYLRVMQRNKHLAWSSPVFVP